MAAPLELAIGSCGGSTYHKAVRPPGTLLVWLKARSKSSLPFSISFLYSITSNLKLDDFILEGRLMIQQQWWPSEGWQPCDRTKNWPNYNGTRWMHVNTRISPGSRSSGDHIFRYMEVADDTYRTDLPNVFLLRVVRQNW